MAPFNIVTDSGPPRIFERFLSEAVHKNNVVSGEAAGWLKKGVTGDFFFHFNFPPPKKMDNTFLPKKKKSEFFF